MRYQIETLATCLREIDDLARELAFEELVSDRSFALDVNWPMYEALDKIGRLMVTTAREDDGRLAGYHVVIWNRHPHRGIVAAEDAASFMHPQVPGRVFKLSRMYRLSIEALRSVGVRHFRFRAKAAHDIGPLLERMGFAFEEKVYAMTVCP